MLHFYTFLYFQEMQKWNIGLKWEKTQQITGFNKFWALPNTYDEALCENNKLLKPVKYFRKKFHYRYFAEF